MNRPYKPGDIYLPGLRGEIDEESDNFIRALRNHRRLMHPEKAHDALEAAAVAILHTVGVDVGADGHYTPPFDETPRRFADALIELTEGHWKPAPNLRTFPYTGSPQLITCLRTQAYCLCPHHLLAVELSCSVGYVVHGAPLPTGDLRTDIKSMESTPSGKVLGLSKIPRLITWASHHLTTQEDLAQLLADKIEEATQSAAIFIHIEGTHSCMRARGIKTNGNVVTQLGRGPLVNQWSDQFIAQLSYR